MAARFLLSLLGGALIGLAATWYWVVTGGVAGVSGILRAALRERGAARHDRLAFLAGLVAAGIGAAALGQATTVAIRPLVPLAIAGLLVGFGMRVGGGCTSGHGVCGLSRLSLRSLVATLTFIAAGAATVFAADHLHAGRALL